MNYEKFNLTARIRKELKKLSTEDLISWYNSYCEANTQDQFNIHKMHVLDRDFQGLTPTEVVASIAPGFNYNDKYFILGIDGVYHSTNNPERYINYDNLSDFIAEGILMLDIDMIKTLNNYKNDIDKKIYSMRYFDRYIGDNTNPSVIISNISSQGFNVEDSYFKIDKDLKYFSFNNLYQYIDLNRFI